MSAPNRTNSAWLCKLQYSSTATTLSSVLLTESYQQHSLVDACICVLHVLSMPPLMQLGISNRQIYTLSPCYSMFRRYAPLPLEPCQICDRKLCTKGYGKQHCKLFVMLSLSCKAGLERQNQVCCIEAFIFSQCVKVQGQ